MLACVTWEPSLALGLPVSAGAVGGPRSQASFSTVGGRAQKSSCRDAHRRQFGRGSLFLLREVLRTLVKLRGLVTYS